MENTFGAFISLKRLEKSISLRQFAYIIKISPEYLSKIENDERPAPSADILIRMSDKLLLSETEKEDFFDHAAKSKSDSTIAVDLIGWDQTSFHDDISDEDISHTGETHNVGVGAGVYVGVGASINIGWNLDYVSNRWIDIWR